MKKKTNIGKALGVRKDGWKCHNAGRSGVFTQVKFVRWILPKRSVTSELTRRLGLIETSINDFWYCKKWSGPKAYNSENSNILHPPLTDILAHFTQATFRHGTSADHFVLHGTVRTLYRRFNLPATRGRGYSHLIVSRIETAVVHIDKNCYRIFFICLTYF